MQDISHSNFQGSKGRQTSTYSNAPRWRPNAMPDFKTSHSCPHCGESLPVGYVICNHCGKSLTSGKCTYCGAPMKETAKFCGKCGQNKEGIICRECGSLNVRNFCRKCNVPLTPKGEQALAAAKSDPLYLKTVSLGQELIEIKEKIEQLNAGLDSDASMSVGGNDFKPELSATDKAMLAEYDNLFNSLGIVSPKETPKPSEPSQETREKVSLKRVSMDDLLKAYKEKAAEMEATLKEIVPPPDFTPEEQRDFLTARKFTALNYPSPMLWVCNWCSCQHINPSDCGRPELGGEWIIVSPEEYYLAGGI